MGWEVSAAAPRWIVYRQIGGYWEPTEWRELGRFRNEEEAGYFAEELRRRGYAMLVREEGDEE